MKSRKVSNLLYHFCSLLF